jgi:hypothetical protein
VIVFLTNESPWPVRNGGRLRMAGLVTALQTELDVVVAVARADNGADVAEGLHPLPVCGRSRLVALLGPGPRLGRGLLDAAGVGALAELCRDAEALVVSHSYLLPVLGRLDLPVVLDLQNLEVERQSSNGGWLGNVEALKARRWEPRAVRVADAVLCVDERDAARAQRWGARRVEIVPNVAPAPVSPPSPAEGPVLAVADWRYGPNAEGLRFLVEQVAPRLDRQLVLAGRGSEVVGGLGFVEDLDPLYDAAALVVSPVVRGAGTQLKVIEALTRGRVVVSTSYGMRSVPQVAQDGCVVADGSTDMSRAVMRLVDDVDDRHRREAHLRAAAIPRSWSEATAGLPGLISEVRRG